MVREEFYTKAHWINIFNFYVIKAINSYIEHMASEKGVFLTWYPVSFKHNCPDDEKISIAKEYMKLKKMRMFENEIGEVLSDYIPELRYAKIYEKWYKLFSRNKGYEGYA